MMIDTSIYGYTIDGGAYHPECTDRRPADHVPGEDCRHPSDDQPYGVFSHDDDGYGLSCDKCGEYIFDPTIVQDRGDLTVDWRAEINGLG